MILSRVVIRFLLSVLLSLGLWAGLSSHPATAAPDSFELLLGQLQPSAAQHNVSNPSSYSPAQLGKLEKVAKEVKSLRSRLKAFQPAIERREWVEVYKG